MPINQVRFNNISRYVGLRNGQDWYEWMVFVDEPQDVLQQIEAVEYLLHRSFPNPLRRRDDRQRQFALESSGWGEFNMRITVFFTDGSRLETSYFLDLSKPWSSRLFIED
jgi:transcription initiation factor IIF auxiliary subunit